LRQEIKNKKEEIKIFCRLVQSEFGVFLFYFFVFLFSLI